MTERPLDLEVLRRGRREDVFRASGDPEDPAWLQGRLKGWLEGRGWAQSRWGEFELVARDAGRARPAAKVRM